MLLTDNPHIGAIFDIVDAHLIITKSVYIVILHPHMKLVSQISCIKFVNCNVSPTNLIMRTEHSNRPIAD